jgi:hypothetical protein
MHTRTRRLQNAETGGTVVMFYANLTREQVLASFPRGGRWCEVGVFSGAYSKRILELITPEELHLVDVWKWTYYDWEKPPESELENIEAFKAWAKDLYPAYDYGHPDKLLETFYQDLLCLAREEKRTVVRVHRGLSNAIARSLPDDYFDAIYVDADHHYDAVLSDLFSYSAKLKSGGILFGDDFLEDLTRRDALYATIDAVSTFTKRSKFKCVLITGYGQSQYVLCREMSAYVERFLANVLQTGQVLVELNDALLSRFAHKVVTIGEVRCAVPSFA